ncbi:DNA gyrase inhibitor YacG [Pseudenhygromyxa sp. WMMC2535]|uniref:DNA gyrase inhibitor YacG n=1 Tax=Pseudenhygromyxa sp. WMMC2535 TaxID=2712867 RepID=UPI001551D65E|nr:DNA gyrase inhibitor YacG [Pseudenhygromyxa sp. WMMC2535]NVB40087.1 DNA gyrase inhibitor YacG [Pseudenhygromyxa sp. WMMC2535]
MSEPARGSETAPAGATRRYRCPTCKKQHMAGPETTHRPFCSDRCKMVDLGRWLDEDYRISRPLGPDDHE